MPRIPRFRLAPSPGLRRGGCRVSAGLALTLLALAGCGPPAPEATEDRATQEATPAEDGLEAASRLIEQADARVARGDRTSCRRAVALYLQALERVQEVEAAPEWEAEIYDRLGEVHRKPLEERHQAIEYYRRALALFEELGKRERQATVLNQLGRVHFALGEMDLAIERYRQALPLKRDRGDLSGEAAVLSNLALVFRYLGEAQQALTLYDRSLEILEELDARLYLGRALNNRGRLYWALGQLRQALTDLDRSLAIARELDEAELEAIALTAIGRIREQQGDLPGALDALEQALERREATAQRRGRAVTLRSLGSVYEKLGRVAEAEELDRQALAIFRRLEARREEAWALTALGRIAAAAGRTGEARRLLDEALPLFRRLRDGYGEIETLLAMARTERARGEAVAALHRTEEALDRIERLRGRAASPDLRRSFLASRRDHYDFHIDLLMELHQGRPDEGHDRRALEAAERSRARSLVELLAGHRETLRAGADPELLARERRLERSLGLVETQRLTLLDEGKPPEQVAALEARLDELVREHRAVRGRILAASPRYASLAEPRILTVAEIQTRVLDPATLLLEFHLGFERGHLWAVTPDSMSSFELPPRAEIEEATRRAYELLRRSHRRRYRAASTAALKRLAHLLLDPVADLLPGKRLLVAADGALHYLPFAALPLPGTEESPAVLVTEHEVVTVPSASALGVLRERWADRAPAPGLLAVIADPVFTEDDPRLSGTDGEGGTETTTVSERKEGKGGLDRLRYSAAEARAILELTEEGRHRDRTFRALGFRATRETATDPELGRYRILHLATHGRIDTARPELSGLVFSRFDRSGRRRQGILHAYEIYNLDLSADLVVLSACDTALGRQIRGEGLVGLTQGFLSAGAAAVLVSLWNVDDRATARLMETFYRRLLAGRTPAAALREAQVELQRETGWRAPYYWAGFVLQGDWSRRMTDGRAQTGTN